MRRGRARRHPQHPQRRQGRADRRCAGRRLRRHRHQSDLHDPDGLQPERPASGRRRRTDSVFGIISMIFWSVTIIVTRHLRAARDARRQRRRGRHHGADHADPARGCRRAARTKLVLAALGIFGASLFFGDSMITPAISVLSAVEGLKVVAAVARAPGRPDHGGDHRRAVRCSSASARRRSAGCSGR